MFKSSRFWAAVLALALCLTASSALAVDATVMDLRSADDYDADTMYVRDEIGVGDTYYALVETYRGNSHDCELRYWKAGMDEAEVIAADVLCLPYLETMEELKDSAGEGADPEYNISELVTDGERLMGFNHVTGRVFAIDVKDGKAVFEDVATIPGLPDALRVRSIDDYSYTVMPQHAAVANGYLLLNLQYWDEPAQKNVQKVLSCSFADGSIKEASVPFCQAMCAYKDGKVVMLSRDPEKDFDYDAHRYNPFDIYVYDPATDKGEIVGQFICENNYEPDFLVYSSALDALIYNDQSKIMGLFQWKESRQVGYLPTTYVQAAAALGDTLVSRYERYVCARTITGDFKNDEYLNFMGYDSEGMMAFADQYPQVPVYQMSSDFNDLAGLNQQMSAGANAPDVVDISYSSVSLDRLISKGYCADLSGYPEIKTFVDSLYEPFRQAVTGPNGEIYAVPYSAVSWRGYSINKKIMDEMGLTMDEMPTNLVELCAFITRWNDEFVEEFINYGPISTSNYKEAMFNLVYREYIAYCNFTGQPLKFDTPVFREAVAAVEAMRTDELQDALKRKADPEQSDYKQGLFSTENMLVGNFSELYTEPSEFSNFIFVPMTLTGDTPYVIETEVRYYIMNPKSQHKDLAAALLNCLIERNMGGDEGDSYAAYTLMATRTDPLPNPYFEEMKEQELKTLADLEQAVADASEEDKADMQAALDTEKAWWEEYQRTREYYISAEAIRDHQEKLIPNVYVAEPMSGQMEEQLRQLIARYRDGNITIDQFIREADGKLLMMQMEE